MKTMFLAAAILAAGTGALAAAQSNGGSKAVQTAAPDQAKICKMVASDERNSKPFEMCLTKTEWAAKAIADAKDANRMVCHYEDEPGTRLHSRKICVTAAEWEDRRQANREVTERIQMQTCVPGAGC